jgi:hypothetical protein
MRTNKIANEYALSWSCFSLFNPRAIVRLEGIGKLKKKLNDFLGNRTRHLPACRTVS